MKRTTLCCLLSAVILSAHAQGAFERDRSTESRSGKTKSSSFDEQITPRQLFWPYLLDMAARGQAALNSPDGEADIGALKALPASAATSLRIAKISFANFLANQDYQCADILAVKRYAYGESKVFGQPKENMQGNPWAGYEYAMQDMPTAEVLPNHASAMFQSIRRHGEPVSAQNVFTCVHAASAIVSKATAILRRSSVVVQDPVTGAPLLVTDNLKTKAKAAFDLAVGETMQDQAFQLPTITARYCRVPTSTGLDSGKATVKCGEYEFDPTQFSYRRGGSVLLDDQTVGGVKVTFANSVRAEKANSASVTDRRKAKIQN